MNEVEKVLANLSQAQSSIHFFGNSDALDRFAKLLESKELVSPDHPDSYLKDDNELWIIEHFEFDCYKHTSKGSQSRREQARIDTAFKRLTPTPDGIVLNETIKGEKGLKYFRQNVETCFHAHYARIDEYKYSLEEKGIIQPGMHVYTMFLIEETSPLGTNVLIDEKREAVLLHRNKWFLDLLKGADKLDYVLTVQPCTNELAYVFIDRKDIDAYYPEIIDYDNKRYLDFTTHIIGGKFTFDYGKYAEWLSKQKGIGNNGEANLDQ